MTALPLFPGTAIGEQNEGHHAVPTGTEHRHGDSYDLVYLASHSGVSALWG